MYYGFFFKPGIEPDSTTIEKIKQISAAKSAILIHLEEERKKSKQLLENFNEEQAYREELLRLQVLQVSLFFYYKKQAEDKKLREEDLYSSPTPAA